MSFDSFGKLHCLFFKFYALCSTVQMLLSEGGVPQRPVVFVSRPELLNRLREKLYRLKEDSGWVTVFGMAGSGKSVLAAEAVRHQDLLGGESALTQKCPIIWQILLKHSQTQQFHVQLIYFFSLCRLLSWWCPLVVHWPVGETWPFAKDPVIMFPSGAESAFPLCPSLSKLFRWGQGASALPHAPQISEVVALSYYILMMTPCTYYLWSTGLQTQLQISDHISVFALVY